MKKILISIVLLGLVCGSVWAQVPEKFRYEVVARDANGVPVAAPSASVRLSVLKNSPAGSVVYCERHSAAIGMDGLLSLEVGGGTRIGHNLFRNINWGADNYYLKVEIDTTGGTDYTFNMVTPIVAVPLVEYAQNIRQQHYSYHDFTDTPTVVSHFINDAGYLTDYEETQTLALSGDTIFISGVEGYVVLPAPVLLDTLFEQADTLGNALMQHCQFPEVLTFAPQNVTSSTVELSAEIQGNSLSGAPASKGFCWATHQAPSEEDHVVVSDALTATYMLTLSGLSSEQTCFARAFAKYGDTVVYGNEVMFKTKRH